LSLSFLTEISKQNQQLRKMATKPIVIVGAGLGGLTLSRALRSHGIASVIYERSKNVPRNNYAITLHPSCYMPLSRMLGLEETDFRKSVAVDAALGGQGRLHHSSYSEDGSFRAHRGTLEAMMSKDLDIRWESPLISVKSVDSHLIANFGNGKIIDTDVLIASDGVHSVVRKSFIPYNKPTVLPYVAINGKRRMQSKRFAETYVSAMDGATTLETRSGTCILQIAMNEHEDDVIGISYTYSRPANSNDPLHNPERDTIGAKEIPPAFFEELSSLHNLPPAFADAFDVEQVKKDRMLSWLMRTTSVNVEDLLSLVSKNIVLIGDSAHAQPILGGNGGNAAIKDGLDLAAHIAEHRNNNLQSFIRTHAEVWQSGVEESVQRIATMHVAQNNRSSL
jgi:2-polyprenyl-6-methoxyphenol hydroxylase-like FAD-dependent oxidoreductase